MNIISEVHIDCARGRTIQRRPSDNGLPPKKFKSNKQSLQYLDGTSHLKCLKYVLSLIIIQCAKMANNLLDFVFHLRRHSCWTTDVYVSSLTEYLSAHLWTVSPQQILYVDLKCCLYQECSPHINFSKYFFFSCPRKSNVFFINQSNVVHERHLLRVQLQRFFSASVIQVDRSALTFYP